jgi:hypothetical protein
MVFVSSQSIRLVLLDFSPFLVFVEIKNRSFKYNELAVVFLVCKDRETQGRHKVIGESAELKASTN